MDRESNISNDQKGRYLNPSWRTLILGYIGFSYIFYWHNLLYSPIIVIHSCRVCNSIYRRTFKSNFSRSFYPSGLLLFHISSRILFIASKMGLSITKSKSLLLSPRNRKKTILTNSPSSNSRLALQ